MRLYHRTPYGEQVHRHGFAPEHADAAGRLWLSGDPADLPSIGRWLIVVDVDDERAEPFRYRLPDGTPYAANFLIPFEVLNEHRPFEIREVADGTERRATE